MHQLAFVLAALVGLSASAANITSTSCTSTNSSGCITIPLYLYSNARGATVQVAGTWVGTLEFEGSNNDTTYYRLRAYPVPNGAYVSSTSNNGAWQVDTAGFGYFRLRASTWFSGTASAEVQPSIAAPSGSVDVSSVPEPVAIFGSTTTTLTPETIAALGPQPYTLRAGDWVSVDGGSAFPIPPDLPDGGPGSLAGRTEIRIVNTSNNQNAVCDPKTADGGLPLWGVRGTPLFANGGYGTWEVRDSERIYCRANTAPVSLAPLEKAQ